MSTPQSGSPSNASSYRQYVPAAVSIVLGGAVTLAVFWAAYSFERRSVRGDFDALADARFEAIDSVTQQFTRLVAFADNVFMVAPSASSPAFTEYLQSLARFLGKDQSHYAAIDAITWVPRVPRDEADVYERAARAAIDPRFEIQRSAATAEAGPDSQREAFFPCYVCVGAPSRPVKPGENMALDPDAWKAMMQARDTGQTVAMTPIKTSNNGEDRFGYRVFQPLYRGGDPGSVAERRQLSDGFLCLDLDVGVLVGKAFEGLRPVGIDIWVVDETAGKDAVLCRHSSRLGLPATGGVGRQSRGQFVAESARTLFGRNVTLYGVSSPTFWSGHVVWQPWVILFIGLALTIAVTGYRYNLAVRSAAIDRAVATRIDSLRLEREQRETKQRESRPLPALSLGDAPRRSTPGAPIDMTESQPAPNDFTSGVPD